MRPPHAVASRPLAGPSGRLANEPAGSDPRTGLERLLPRRLAHRLLLAVGVPLALATLAASVIFGGLRAAIVGQTELQRIDRVVEAIGELRLHLLEAQAGLRGFVLSGNEAFLAPYDGAARERPATVAELEQLLAEDSLQRARLLATNALFEKWRGDVAEPAIDESRTTPFEHVEAAIDARGRLIELGAASDSDAIAALARFRASAEAALASTTRSDLIEAWQQVVARIPRLPGGAQGSARSVSLRSIASQLAPATAQASGLSLQRHREAILSVVDGTGNQLVEEMRAIGDEMLRVSRAHLVAATDRMARTRRLVTGTAAAGLALAIILGLFVALALARRLHVPIRSITRASEAIEEGDLAARAVALGDDELGRLARTFNGMADRLERRNREVSTLHDLSQLLQTAGDANEAFEIFERLTPVLLPGGSGTVHVISPSRVDLEPRARFGNHPPPAEALASPNDCWGLRKGQSHLVESADRKLVCAHLGGRDGLRDPYACLPLVSQNETLGLLHVAFAEAELGGRSIETRRGELEAIANALGLALGNLALREKLKAQSVRDVLTGLYNRRFLEEALPREIERCRRRGLPLVVAMADLDHFKRLNDTWGHEAGDLAIQRFAETLRRNFRQEDILCRYGGEEFCLVLPECSLEDARRRSEQLLTQMRTHSIQFGREAVGPVTVSLGLVEFPADAGTGEALIRAADTALYRAKQTGRDRIVKYHPKHEAA